MTVTVTTVATGGVYSAIATVSATAASDVSAEFNHGLAVAPIDYTLTLVKAATLAQTTASSEWAVTAVGATSITITRNNVAGNITDTGDGQVRIICRRPHSIVR